MWRCIIRAKHNGHVVINAVMSLMRVSYISRNYASPVEKSPFADREIRLFRFSLSLYFFFLSFLFLYHSLSPPLPFLVLEPFFIARLIPIFRTETKTDAVRLMSREENLMMWEIMNNIWQICKWGFKSRYIWKKQIYKDFLKYERNLC